jgi:hypothetical protein
MARGDLGVGLGERSGWAGLRAEEGRRAVRPRDEAPQEVPWGQSALPAQGADEGSRVVAVGAAGELVAVHARCVAPGPFEAAPLMPVSPAGQAPLQRWYPRLQVTPQAPPEQVAVAFAGAVQTFPQAPQLLTSAWALTQALPQRVYPVAHTKSQRPLVQTGVALAGAVQTVPQAPQLCTSLAKLTQAPLQQSGVPAGQQTWPQRSGWPVSAAGHTYSRAPVPWAA